MRTHSRSTPRLLLFLFSIAALADSAIAQNTAQQDIDDCRQNLRLISDAIRAFRAENKDIPNELAELHPRHLSESAPLICPAARHLGVTSGEATGVSRSREVASATTYSYEFRPVPIPESIAGGSERTMREWKRLQMGLLGSEVPIVRCHLHSRSINLSFGGDIFETTLDWEDRHENRVVKWGDLSFARLFQQHTVLRVIQIRERDPAAPAWLIDLSDHYNASLKRGWQTKDADNNLACLPAGLTELNGTRFDIRGIVQLGAGNPTYALSHFPQAVSNIVVKVRCQRLHFLQAAAYTTDRDTLVGHYTFHRADGRTEQLPLLYGRHLRDWWSDPDKPGRIENLLDTQVAWRGSNETSQAKGESIFLYQTRWNNPHPEVEIRSIDFVSALSPSGPFLIAITADPLP